MKNSTQEAHSMTKDIDLDALQARVELCKVQSGGFGTVAVPCNYLGSLITRLRKAEAVSDIDSIDGRFTQRLALLLECMLIDQNGYWNEAASLLDEYRSAWDKINPQPPTFMGEPMPPERRERVIAIKTKRENEK